MYDDRYERPRRLGQVLAWVGIIAGVVFIVAVVFFSGFVIGKHSGAGYGRFGGHEGMHMFHRGGPPPMGPAGMRSGPDQRGPGHTGPGSPGSSLTTTIAPTPSPTPR